MPSLVVAGLSGLYYELLSRYAESGEDGVAVLLTDADGIAVGGDEGFPCAACGLVPSDYLQMSRESLRWGEPYVGLCPRGHYVWAVPLTANNRLLGGVSATLQRLSDDDNGQAARVHGLAYGLLSASIAANATNACLMAENRREADFEASRATAIHTLKEAMYTSIREIYVSEEQSIREAMRSGDRPSAREVLNRVLVGVYSVGAQDLDLLKAAVLEFVVVMYRFAVEAGGDPVEMLALNYRAYLSLFRLGDETTLAHWLVEHLERLMDCLKLKRDRPPEARLQEVINQVNIRYQEGISRDSVADAVGISPSHLSHILRDKLGTTFRELLTDVRVAKAREQLAHGGKTLVQIAQETGFADQSHFTKVFKRHTGMTPKEFQRFQHR